jgi:hypothetical protein
MKFSIILLLVAALGSSDMLVSSQDEPSPANEIKKAHNGPRTLVDCLAERQLSPIQDVSSKEGEGCGGEINVGDIPTKEEAQRIEDSEIIPAYREFKKKKGSGRSGSLCGQTVLVIWKHSFSHTSGVYEGSPIGVKWMSPEL